MSYDYVVAVTDGVFVDDVVPITAWCFQEGPGHPHQERYRRYHDRIVDRALPVWCVKGAKDRWINHWDLPEMQVFDEYSILDLIEQMPYEPRKWISKKRNNVRPFGGSSMFYALARLIVEGARDIHIYGADFDGYGNFDPRSGKAEVNKRHPNWWDDRWNYERNLIEDIQREAARVAGITITRHTGTYDIQEAKQEHWVDVDGWL